MFPIWGPSPPLLGLRYFGGLLHLLKMWMTQVAVGGQGDHLASVIKIVGQLVTVHLLCARPALAPWI